MPVYSFRNEDTNEEFEETMKFSDMDDFLKENTNVKQIFTRFPGTVDSVRIGIRKPDSSFNDVLMKAKSAHKHSTIDTR
jgi:hypothetical protein